MYIWTWLRRSLQQSGAHPPLQQVDQTCTLAVCFPSHRCVCASVGAATPAAHVPPSTVSTPLGAPVRLRLPRPEHVSAVEARDKLCLRHAPHARERGEHLFGGECDLEGYTLEESKMLLQIHQTVRALYPGMRTPLPPAPALTRHIQVRSRRTVTLLFGTLPTLISARRHKFGHSQY